MRIEELPVEPALKEALLKAGYLKLYPPQEQAIRHGVLDGKSILLAAPTASGKTLVGEIAAVSNILRGGKAVYLTPLKAIASEKYEKFQETYSSLGIRVSISLGDYTSRDADPGRSDLLVTTYEKFDSLTRHTPSMLQALSCIVLDEIHLASSETRGGTLEVIVANLKAESPSCQMIGLSATVSNVSELASWLEAEPVVSNWRPVPLLEGVYLDGAVHYQTGARSLSEAKVSQPVEALVKHYLRKGGQALVFYGSRSRAQKAAMRLARCLKIALSQGEAEEVYSAIRDLESKVPATPTTMELVDCIKRGVAFHHAGLPHEARKTVESLFREGCIKVVCSTPTLAAGVNLPARLVVIRDYRRYEAGIGQRPIPVMEYKQMCIPGDMRVHTPHGPTEIRDLKLGDQLLSPGSGSISYVTRAGSRIASHIIEVEAGSSYIAITPEHPVLTPAGWAPAASLSKGSKIALAEGSRVRWAKVLWLHELSYPERVYNLTLAPTPAYIVEGVIVHNCGRAGRPGYDELGEAVIIAKSRAELEALFESYIRGEPEPIESKLSNPPALRSHVLGVIATWGPISRSEVAFRFSKTLFAIQYGQTAVQKSIAKVIKYLASGGFISRKDNMLSATKLGQATAKSYIDPKSASLFQRMLREAKKTPLYFIYMVASAPDMEDLPVRRSEVRGLLDFYYTHSEEFPQPEVSTALDELEYGEFLSAVKKTAALVSWINERSEREIEEKLNVQLGDLARIVDSASWLLKAASMIARALGLVEESALTSLLERRVRHGVREELLELVKLEGVGRIRARRLYEAGYRSLSDLASASIDELSRIPGIGRRIAASILSQLGIEHKPVIEREKRTLSDFLGS